MTEEEFNKYIDSISNTEEFKEIDDFIRMSSYEGDTLAQKVKKYLSYHHTLPYTSYADMFTPDLEYFKRFFEAYTKREKTLEYDEEGFLDLGKTLYLIQPIRYAKSTGAFTDSYYLFPDGTNSIAKVPLFLKGGKSGVNDTSCLYCATIASGIAKILGVNAVDNILARRSDGFPRTLSKNFLRPGEELVTFYADAPDSRIHKTSEVLQALDDSLRLRNYPNHEIEEAKLEFLKQEFLARMIGLVDQKPENTGIITSMDETGRHVRLAPAFDFDYSFHIGEPTELMFRVADNGLGDVGSLIKQYKDYPGFFEFIKSGIEAFSMEKVYQNLYENMGVVIFEKPEESEELKKFTDYVNKNIIQAKAVINELEYEERGEK